MPQKDWTYKEEEVPMCEVCGSDVDGCACSPCKKCLKLGDPRCYTEFEGDCGGMVVKSSVNPHIDSPSHKVVDTSKQDEAYMNTVKPEPVVETRCSHYSEAEGSYCHECWFGEESGIPIERLPGNTTASRCPRVSFVSPEEVALSNRMCDEADRVFSVKRA